MFKPIGESPERRQPNVGKWQLLCPVPESAPAPPNSHPKLGEPTAIYHYKTTDGKTVGYIFRFATDKGKEFRPLTYRRHVDTGKTGWRWQQLPTPSPLFLQEELSERPDAPVLVCEGEKATLAAKKLLPDYVAVTCAGGCNGFGQADRNVLNRRRVVIWPDADAAGQAYARSVAANLKTIAQSIHVLTPPSGVVAAWDAGNALDEGWTDDQAEEFLATAAPFEFGENTGDERSTADEKTGRRGESQASLIADLVDGSWLWHSETKEAYVTVPVNEHEENYKIDSEDFQSWLVHRFHQAYASVPGAQAINDALRLLKARAVFEGPSYTVWLRSARYDNKIYVDICDEKRKIVEVDHGGWRVIANSPVKFRRTRHMRSLPEPMAGEPIEHLRGFLNVATDADFCLVVAWLLAALLPIGPYPVLLLNGRQGSSKSTVSRVLRSLVDPHSAPIRSVPKDEHDLMISADSNHCLVFDNISGISGRTSDALSRVSTGGGFSTRRLYQNREEEVFNVSRPMIINGINEVIGKPDFMDRAIVLSLPAIDANDRKPENELLAGFEAARASIFGTLLDGVSSFLRHEHDVELAEPTRMADFCKNICAAAPGLGIGSDKFQAAYRDNLKDASSSIIEDNEVAQGIIQLVSDEGFEGSAAELLERLNQLVPEPVKLQRSWPKNAQSMGSWMKRHTPALVDAGLHVEKIRAGKERTRLWIIRRQ